jgi:hypothetical protein
MSHNHKSERGCRLRRRVLRLQLGVNRKSTAVRWMGSLTVGVEFPSGKRTKGPKGPSSSQRKTRRGQRGSGNGFLSCFIDREASRLLVSAVRSAAPNTTPAPQGKPRTSRVVNHSGRKFLWAVKAANRIAARKPVLQLMEKVPGDFGHLSRAEASAAVRELGVGDSSRWVKFSRWWHLYSYKCRHLGVPTEGSNPLHFLCLRAPHVGGLDLLELIQHLRPPSPPPRHTVCRSCGNVGPPGTHVTFSECVRLQREERATRENYFGLGKGARRRR